MHSALYRLRVCSVPLSCLAVVAFARLASAQDAPSVPSAPVEAPSAPAAPTEPPAAAPSEPPAVAPPAAPAPPPDAPPVAAPAPSVAPAPAPPSSAAPTGSAAFSPLPETPREHAKPKAKPKPVASPTPAEARDSEPVNAELAPAPVPPDSAPPGTAPSPRANDESKDDSGGVFGPFRLGVLVGGGLPEVLSLGGQLKLTRFFGAGVNIGIIPTVQISYYGEATLAYQEYDAYAHLYPFGGSFFIGAGAGYATIKGSLASHFSLASYKSMCPAVDPRCASIPDFVDPSSQASVRTLVLTPQIGFLHLFGSGFSIGLDVGAQIPIAPSQIDFSTQVPNVPLFQQQIQDLISPNDAKVRSTLEKIGRTPLPTFNLKIGWFL